MVQSVKSNKGLQDPIKRFMNHVEVSGTGCWIWNGATSNGGYGVFRVSGKNHIAHRWLYEEVHGKIPDGVECDHLCRNRICVNPSHIEAVTKLENVRRGESGKWQREKTHCPNGHEYTIENTKYCSSTVRGRKYVVRRCKQCIKEYRETPEFIEWNKAYQNNWKKSKRK